MSVRCLVHVASLLLVAIATGNISHAADFVPFAPPPDGFDARSVIDLRGLNESRAGQHGWVTARAGHFFLGDGRPVRFWGVNGPATRDEALRREARQLAKYGVNLVRSQIEPWDKLGNAAPDKAREVAAQVATLKREGIYTHLSCFFPLAFRPPAGTPGFEGYDGKRAAVAAIFFNPILQRRHRSWLRTLLTTPGADGTRLIDEPALFGLELVNEDSLLFWTFTPDKIPDAQLRPFEAAFAAWLTARHGTLARAVARWQGIKTARDDFAAGRVGFRPHFELVERRTPRDLDTVAFLVETERRFYVDTVAWLRELGFRGLITTSNWQTADPVRLGPLLKHIYSVGDFVDRHGYFGSHNRGPDAEWALRTNHTYVERSALRFEPEAPQPGVARLDLVQPVLDTQYGEHPSMLSEVAFTRPNRYRSEAVFQLAAYGALQDSDAIVFFQKEGADFSPQPGLFMQPWTVASPAMMGQFPALARLYREGLVRAGDLAVDLALPVDRLLSLAGTPLPEGGGFDELRRADLPAAPAAYVSIIDPLIHFVGRSRVRFVDRGEPPAIPPRSTFIDRAARRVRSNTGELSLDWGRGLVTLAAPRAAGASGNLAAGGRLTLGPLVLESPLALGQVVLVSLDGRPLGQAQRLLLQVMSEEQPTGFRSEALGGRARRIVALGNDPWQFRAVAGRVALGRPDAARLRVVALDHLGLPTPRVQRADAISLEAATLYYLIEGEPR